MADSAIPLQSWLAALQASGVLARAPRWSGRGVESVFPAPALAAARAWLAAQSPAVASRERRATIELCVWMAHVDRDVDPSERWILHDLVGGVDLDEDDSDALIAATHDGLAIDGIEGRLTHPVLRELALAVAWHLVLADGRISPEEQASWDTVGVRLGIPRPRLEQLRNPP
jgi:hypothetical protein